MIQKQYIIREDKSLKDAIVALNAVSSEVQTLFVEDEAAKIVGTLTDGDIRRGIIAGAPLDCKICEVMHENFAFLYEDQIEIELLRKLRERYIYFIPILNRDGQLVDAINLKKTISRLPVDAVLMAGGKGERLRPLTDKTPKPLLTVGDKCIIDHNVDRLISYGVKNISVTVNYLKEQIEEHFSSPRNGVLVQCVTEPEFLGTIGSIKFVKEFHNDTILVMNSDLFTNIDYEDFFLHFLSNDAVMSVAAVPYNVSIPYGILDVDGRDIKGLLEKPQYTYYANAGIYLIKKSALVEIPDEEFFNATDLIEKLIANGKKVIRYPLNGTWIDIGNPQEYQKAQDLVKHML